MDISLKKLISIILLVHIAIIYFNRIVCKKIFIDRKDVLKQINVEKC